MLAIFVYTCRRLIDFSLCVCVCDCRYVQNGGDPDEWERGEDPDAEFDKAWGVLQRGRDEVNGAWAPTEVEAYAMQMAQQQTVLQGNGGGVQAAGLGGVGGGGGAGLTGPRLLAVLTAAWLAKDVATRVFRARL